MNNIKMRKTVSTYVDVETEFTPEEIMESLEDHPAMEGIIEEMGYVKKEDLNLTDTSILGSIKQEVVAEIIKKATLEQLEQFVKSL